MKKLFRLPLYMALIAVSMLVFTSCSDDETEGTDEAKEQALSAAVSQYVNNTVIGTYKSLADETILLYDALVVLKGNKTDVNVRIATERWIEARNYWELSEAFLFGPASDFGIDPHIDTWPLAINELKAELENASHISSMNQEDGDEWVANYLGFGLLGFHGIEYILFENGAAKSANKISDKELIYAVAVAGDLRNQCFRLEASWAGIENVADDKREKLESLELGTTVNGGKYSYGQDMLNAGKAGSTKASVVDACEDIIEGCITIADEVGAMKIGQPYKGDDENYIESPYSDNSKVDFEGNIISIRNAYLGGPSNPAALLVGEVPSVGLYIKQVDPALDTRIRNAIDNAIAKIKAIPGSFTTNYSSDEAGAAMDACNELAEILGDAKKALNK
ncbi:MAG: imelysin family protein [Dysgonomonas sp.]